MNPHLKKLLSTCGDLIPAVGDTLNPLSHADVAAIEARVDRPLDSVHREMLMSFGASRFEDDVFFTPEVAFPKSYSKSNTGIVGIFLGKLNENYPKAKGISVLHKLNIHNDDLPPDFVPIADVGSGDLYGSRLDGSVWLWIHDALAGKELTPVSSSMPAWLDLLHRKRV